jgi:hypothetical protein
MFGERALVCMRIAALSSGDAERWRLYEKACARYSEKAINAKFEELISRGYMECGVSARTAWLTDKGLAALNAGKEP